MSFFAGGTQTARNSSRNAFIGGAVCLPKVRLDEMDVSVVWGMRNLLVSSIRELKFMGSVETLPGPSNLDVDIICLRVELKEIAPYMTHVDLSNILKAHNVKIPRNAKKAYIQTIASCHQCIDCARLDSLFKPKKVVASKTPLRNPEAYHCPNIEYDDFTFVDYVSSKQAGWYHATLGYIRCLCSLNVLVSIISFEDAVSVLKKHGIDTRATTDLSVLITNVATHICLECDEYVSIFRRSDFLVESTDKDIRPIMTLNPLEDNPLTNPHAYVLLDYVQTGDEVLTNSDRIPLNVSLHEILPFLNKRGLAWKVARRHSLSLRTRSALRVINKAISDHICQNCPDSIAIFAKKGFQFKDNFLLDVQAMDVDVEPIRTSIFPPKTPSQPHIQRIISDFCESLTADSIEERGCAVCGLLCVASNMVEIRTVRNFLHILEVPNVAAIERKTENQPIRYHDGPVLDKSCNHVCEMCRGAIRKGRVPKNALCRGLWLGEIPYELRNMRAVEKMLIARVRHNYCVARVSRGHRKLKCNVVCFETPVEKVYKVLPPPIEEIDDVLAILFTGPAIPTKEDLSRTPFLVRRRVVLTALKWLVINHAGYRDVIISQKNLEEYPEDKPPVDVVYKKAQTNKTPESMSLFDQEDEDGVENGYCPFVVHGLTGESSNDLTVEEMKGIAIRHWDAGNAALRVGQASKPYKTFKNPMLYPNMFPWLFPYGRGGPGSARIKPDRHKRLLMMYHDKRFQLDEYFTLVAFNHEQIHQSSTGSFILVSKPFYPQIVDRILSVNEEVFHSLAERMANGENVNAKTARTSEEKACFNILNDLDHINGKVSGSVTSKKWMRSELWSLIAHKGAPVWYITLNPSDSNHPVCLYYAGSDYKFEPNLLPPYEDRLRLISRNPAACARFFHHTVENFIRHIMGYAKPDGGVFGQPSAYYGAVEQQGRLSLHLHLLVWIEGAPNPNVSRQLILDSESNFAQSFISYLESCHQGELFGGSLKDVESRIAKQRQEKIFQEPHTVLPIAPPNTTCQLACASCEDCKAHNSWWDYFHRTCDSLVCLLHKHVCMSTLDSEGKRSKRFDFSGCFDNIYKRCKARFPREIFTTSMIDPETGSINVKHKEPWINAFSPVITYLLRCNTDVTSLRSGTAIKAVILYVSNYVTKTSLKTNVMFDVVRSVFSKNESYLRVNSSPAGEKARMIMTKMVNGMSAKLEIGSPMAALYLLGFPDHYTDHTFVPFFWQGFVSEVSSVWADSIDVDIPPEKVTIQKRSGMFSNVSFVDHYVNRGCELEDMCVYEWVSRCRVQKIPNSNPVLSRTKASSDRDGSDQESALDSPMENASGSHEHHVSWRKARTICFRQGYTHAHTHWILCKPVNSRHIPNFIGRSLPRKDKGDHEYYSMTMLTLFKPWRTGRDLRRCEDETWSQAFDSYNFSPAQKQLMENFHVKYECIDAKDDYYAKLKSGAPGIPSLPLMTDPEFDELNSSLEFQVMPVVDDSNYLVSTEGLDEIQPPLKIGRGQIRRENAMTKMRDLLVTSGWSESLLHDSDLFDASILDNIPSHLRMSASEWKRILACARQNEIDARKANLPALDKLYARQKQMFTGVDVVTKDFMIRQRYLSSAYRKIATKLNKIYDLNTEQERAFRIITQHASTPGSSQLRMYVGGMAGTGKSQVIRAVIDFFIERKESHRIVIVAPTGNAASLLNGSTYHYMFGLSSFKGHMKTKVELVRSRLKGVEYVFLDEVSMLSCRDLDKIHRRLCETCNNSIDAFGGINFVFAGDFAQLPPVPSHELGALWSRTFTPSSKKISAQEQACGKALWQQVNVVVILRRNMRQDDTSTQDSKLRRALENMRYKSCDMEDILFLRSKRHFLRREKRNNLSFPTQFRNVSVITAHHVDIDVFNEIGAQRLASDTKQALVKFYSDDVEPVDEESSNVTDLPKSSTKRGELRTGLSEQDVVIWQELWSQPPSANSLNIPGCIPICKGMPVMIQHNSATELNITRGQEGVVVDWIPGVGERGQPVIEVLFVKISTQKREAISINGLPPNVVPLTRMKTSIKANLSDDSSVNVSRSQIEVVLNFAMTDYQSQGKTRINNVVHLRNMRNHLSYYTALSRGKTAEGTLILDDFDTTKISGGGMNVALKQEFRELELLDEVTRLRYEGLMPSSTCNGEDRISILSEYREIKGHDYVPETVHPAIRWDVNDPFLDFTHSNVDWRCRNKKEVTSQGRKDDSSKTGSLSLGRTSNKRTVQSNQFAINAKRQKLEPYPQPIFDKFQPIGTSWSHNSCAYDAVITILRNIWFDRPNDNFRSEFGNLSRFYGRQIVAGLEASKYVQQLSFDGVRNDLMRKLSEDHPELFQYRQYADVTDILVTILQHHSPVWGFTRVCTSCGPGQHTFQSVFNAHMDIVDNTEASDLSGYFRANQLSSQKCRQCGRTLIKETQLVFAPCLLTINIGHRSLSPTYEVQIPLVSRTMVSYELKGIIYFSTDHFTSRYIRNIDDVWFHDGIQGSRMIQEGHVAEQSLGSRGRYMAVTAIYITRPTASTVTAY